MLNLRLEPCRPAPWANGGHRQTLLGHLLPSPKLAQKGERMEVPLPDGDRLVGYFIKGETSVIVYLFHGLAGNIDSTYMHRSALLARAQGHSVFMVNHRSCGEGAGLASHPYHSGRGEDLAAALALGKKRFPRHTHLAIGFSLSGNALLLLLAGMRGDTLPDFAISVNAPIDLNQVSRVLGTGFNRVYDLKFFIQCRWDVMHSRRPSDPRVEVPYLTTLYEFDKLYTAPAGGFKSREDYYSSCSTVDLLGRIKTPTVVLSALDDPFVAGESYLRAQPSSAVHLHLEKFGGHMGYIHGERTPYGSRRWLDYALVESIQALLQ